MGSAWGVDASRLLVTIGRWIPAAMADLPDRVTVRVGLDEADDAQALREAVARRLRRPASELPELTLLRRSIDARGRNVRFQLEVAVGVDPHSPPPPRPREVSDPGVAIVIVGDGPAGLFCAYELASRGIACTVLDRGKTVQPRRRDLKILNKGGRVPEDSNYCFGEGGAGTYSDGKLYTRANKRGNVRGVLSVLVDNGATPGILVDARPHIGSNKLPKVITSMRERLQAVGVEFRFGAKVVGLLTRDGAVVGVRLADGEELEADRVVLATGHSARDVHLFVADAGVRLEPKPFALGVRIEHPQPLINAIQYGSDAGHPKLPAASYRLATTVDGRGVFSFCMCPGGWIVPASTTEGELVVNGMSLSKRDSPFANSGFVVAIEPHDWALAGFDPVRGGVELQRRIEEAAWEAGGGRLVAPAARVADFLAGRTSTTLPRTSYIPGLQSADLAAVLDVAGLPIAARIREALQVFGRQMRGYLTEEAILVATESRTSSPLRIPRDPTTLEASLAGLYPAGEGAGYAGGIVSAAIDGVRVAERIAAEVEARARS